MSDYTIYALAESQITLSTGILDGVSQGDGSHLVGRKITLDSNAWEAVAISDASTDTNFADNDGNQRLDGAQTIFGTPYADGTRVEAEYQFTAVDPNGNSYTIIGFNLRNSSPAYSTIEGLAFIGSFPPIDVELDITAAFEGPSNTGGGATPFGTYAAPPCFTKGTLIDTPYGPRSVEDLAPGDLVLTADHGPQPLRVILNTTLSAGDLALAPKHRPVRIKQDALGPGVPSRDIVVSPQHHLLMEDWRTQLMFGASEVLAPAKHLINGHEIRWEKAGKPVAYYHLLLDQHSLVHAHGMLSESFFPGDTSVRGLDQRSRQALFGAFTNLRGDLSGYGTTARRSLRRHEAVLLAA